jgi:hypothetical protein
VVGILSVFVTPVVLLQMLVRWRIVLLWCASLTMIGGGALGIWWHQVFLMSDPDVRRERFLEKARDTWPCYEHIDVAGPKYNECLEREAYGYELRYQRNNGRVVE